MGRNLEAPVVACPDPHVSPPAYHRAGLKEGTGNTETRDEKNLGNEEKNKIREVLPCSACQTFSKECITHLAVRHESVNTLFITCSNRLLALVKLPCYYKVRINIARGESLGTRLR